MALLVTLILTKSACGSTYVVYIPLDSPIYMELETLNGLGYLESYLDEIKPISRVEAARLILEAERNLSDSDQPDLLAAAIVRSLHLQFEEEIRWLRDEGEDRQPSTLHPLERLEAEYVYTRGERRRWDSGGSGGIHASEGTPLDAGNDGIATGAGSNEIARWAGWAGVGSFLTMYGEGAIAGPVTRNAANGDRSRVLGAETVLCLGNTAVSFGQQEMRWGTGHFAALSQGDNSAPFPGLRVQNVHPRLLPGFLRYLGQSRFQLLIGQLDGERSFAHPWISAEILSLKPLPTLEFGLTHAIMFGGRGNDRYGAMGFVGRLTGLATGSPTAGNTNSRAGVYLKVRLPALRNLELYQEILGEDNLTNEVAPIGRFLPFLAVSYQGGVYLPRLTSDGRTDFRFEYALLEPNYSVHSDSLYWTYNQYLMGDPLGPNASRIDLAIGRWVAEGAKASVDAYYTQRAATFAENRPYPANVYGSDLSSERSVGVAFDFVHVPEPLMLPKLMLTDVNMRAAFEHVAHMNFGPSESERALLILSIGFTPRMPGFCWPRRTVEHVADDQ